MPCAPPRPDPRISWCLFLDFDGTLTEIVATPADVRVDSRVPTLLRELSHRMDGALALVSGRPIAEIDQMLTPLDLPIAGLHGLERRGRDGRIGRPAVHEAALAELHTCMAQLAGQDSRLLVEDKGPSMALHFRAAPEREQELTRIMSRVVGDIKGYRLMHGKMVLEALPETAGKGKAIEAFMREAPFRGRQPVFAGDDVTDESGFAAVNALGGLSIKVGGGNTAAVYRVAGVGDLLAWLAGFCEPAGAPGPSSQSRRIG